MKDYGALFHARGDMVNGSGIMLPASYYDKVFCISVLEELGDWRDIMRALDEFRRIVRPSGKIVVTVDVPFVTSEPTPLYKGLDIGDFVSAVDHAGLEFVGQVNYDRDEALNHPEYNLCVFHCVLQKVRI